MPLVDVRDLWVRYGRFTAVRQISFQIPRGEIFGFVGPNGAGKTTTIKVLATLLKPTAGRVEVDGMSVRRRPMDVRRRIGYAPDFFGVYDDLTVDEYLHFFASAYAIPRPQRKGLIGDMLELTDLTRKAKVQVDSLSRGMKQRLGLARVLLHDPDLLLLDEPASGLDPRARIEMRELLKELRRMGKTILVSSHILHELAELCTRIGIIEAGRMVAEGSLRDIYRELDLKRTVHVQIRDLDLETEGRLKTIPGVDRLERYSDRLSFHIREEELAVEDLLDRIRALGARIRMFQPEAMDMETVFMKLTRGKTA